MKIRLLLLTLALAISSALAQDAAPPQPQPADPVNAPQLPAQPPAPALPAAPAATPVAGESVNISFPRTSVFEVLSFYETLTGKRLIRDSNLAGPELSIMVPQPVSRQEAIRLIESSLLLNGYTLVPTDNNTIKVLGPSRAPRTEGLPLYTDVNAIPSTGDQVVSFYKSLSFISPEEAKAVLEQVVQTNPFGSIALVPNTNALVITDKTPVILKALALLALIDVEPAQVVTEFVPLQRASAERIVEILETMFEKKDEAGRPAASSSGQPAAPGPDGQPAAANAASGARYENRLIAGQARFLADKRTNRVLVVTRVENYRYVRDIIQQLDAAGSFEEPYVRTLNYVPAADVFPVLSEMLSDPDTEKSTSEASAQATPANTQNNFNDSSSGGLSQGGGLSRPDRLTEESGQAAPQSATLGEIRLIGDNSSNSIIVFGPPEAKLRAKQILDLMDQRPKQVYLAVVIGQLRVTNDLDYGVSYLIRYKGGSGNGIAASMLNPGLFPGLTGTLPNPSEITGTEALTNGLSALSGLTVFGTIADSVDVFAKFLESTNRFRTLARPVIYTTNNRKATILSGQKVPVPTSTLTTATGGGNTGDGQAITSNIQYEDVVLKLEVIPLINSDREVNLVIAQTNDNIVGQDTISGNQVPRIATQELTTSVRVPNGSTIVLGGLITDDTDKNNSGIPYLNRIPVVGPLFGGRVNNKFEKRELVVMIQPVVVDSNNEMHKASAWETDRNKLGRDAAAMAAPIAEQAREPAPWQPSPSPTPKPKKKKPTPAANGQSR